MIRSLRLAGLGVIDSADLELGDGLTVLTGETGAGKTMVITSLQLLLGGRASADLVRSGAERAQVTAVLELPTGSALSSVVDGVGGVVEEQELTATRTVAAGGRSRAVLGGAGIPVAVLSEVGAELVVIHGQHDQSKLVAAGRQRELLDRFGGLVAAAGTVSERFDELRALVAERDELVARHQERLREIDALTFGLGEVSGIGPVPDEDVALQVEEVQLAHAVELKQAAQVVGSALSDDEASLLEQLAQLQRGLDVVREHDQRLDALATRLAEVGYLASDVSSDLHAYADSVEADPERLAEVQERRAALTALTRKYGPELKDVLAWAAEAEQRLAVLTDSDERLALLEPEIVQARAAWTTAALDLSEQRRGAAETLSAQATDELTALAMPDAELVVEVSTRAQDAADGAGASSGGGGGLRVTLPDGRSAEASRTGLDDVQYLLRPHRGAPLTPIQRGASGGELSRVMLALEVVLADVDPVPTVVFDEVDAGVGGTAAVEVGRRLARLGASRQVLVVTHLPQVAAFADHHWLVRKSTSGEVTASDVTVLDDPGRVKELTRMLAGLSDSSSGQAHAEELLEVARESR